MYLRYKSFQRFAETWALLERVAGAGLLAPGGLLHGLVHPNQATGESWRLVSLGGGPGFELLAADWFVKWWVASGGKVRHPPRNSARKSARNSCAIREQFSRNALTAPTPLPGRRHFVPRERQVRGRAAAEQPRVRLARPPAELGRVRPTRAVPTHRATPVFTPLTATFHSHSPQTSSRAAGTSTRSATDSHSGTCTAAAPRRCTPAARAPARRRRTSTRRSRRRRRRSRRSR